MSVSSEIVSAIEILREGNLPEDLIFYGSVGRRFLLARSLIPNCSTVQEWLITCKEGTNLGLRRNGSGRVDIDVGVAERIGWEEIVNQARKITFSSREIMVDPHLIRSAGDKRVYIKNIAGKPISVINNLTEARIKANSDSGIFIPDLDSLLAQMLAVGRIRKKDAGEIMRLVITLQATDKGWKEHARESWWPYMVAYLRSNQWVRDAYIMMTNYETRNLVRKFRGKPQLEKPKKISRLDSTDPVYM